MGKTGDLAKFAVPVEKLRWICPPDVFQFECTADVEPLKEFIGQKRALDAINFGLGIDGWGYNLFLTGLTGTGKARIVKSRIERYIKECEAKGIKYDISDWCYVYNFSDPDRPKALKLGKGKGKSLREDMDWLVKKLTDDIPKVFGQEEYGKRKQEKVAEQQKAYQSKIDALDKEAREKNLMVQISSMGAAIVPLVEGRPMSRSEFLALSDKEREAIEEKRQATLKKVDDVYAELHEMEREMSEELKKIDHQAGEFALAGPFNQLLKTYSEYPSVVEYLNKAKEYTLNNLSLFIGQQTAPQMPGLPMPPQTDPYIPYRINLFVDNSSVEGPPVIIESNPNWFNVFGRIERRALMGTYTSDHTMIKAGAAQHANGGYLVLNIRDVLLNQGVWEGIKRIIKNKEVRVEDPWEQYSFFTPMGMRPDPIPINLKITVMGDNYLYQMLAQYDEEFWEMFKVKADFDNQIERNDENIRAYACFIRSCCDEETLLPFDRSGVAKVVEHSVRQVADQKRLSARFGPLKDLLIEANYWAKEQQSPRIMAEHLEKAIQKKIYRLDLVAERLRQLIKDGTIMVDIEGAVPGQVNGLAVFDMGSFSFGRPSRITARTFMGRKGIINIERESQLSGPIHDKGVFILSGFLGAKYAQSRPLNLSASVCFEQSYSGVEGDSASSTELYSILSSLSGVPIRQNIAVTGSVNQKGEVQPIGGVNQKVEGFFDVCRESAGDLTGEQGVMMPHQNVQNLMLREDVVDAVKQGKFHIYSVKTIDEGIEILTGVPAGERQADGSYPEGTINFLVNKKLAEFAESMKGYSEQYHEKA